MPALVVVVLLVIVVVLAVVVVVVPVVVGVVRDKEERRRPAGRDECDIIEASPSVGVTSRKTSLPFCANRSKDNHQFRGCKRPICEAEIAVVLMGLEKEFGN